MLSGYAFMQPNENIEPSKTSVQDLTPDELKEMIQLDMSAIQEKIDSGELDADMGLYAFTDYDEEGRLVHYYEESIFASTIHVADKDADDTLHTDEDTYDLPKELREKVIFTLLSCHLAKDEFDAAQKLANVLKHSDNKYYNYFGIYECHDRTEADRQF